MFDPKTIVFGPAAFIGILAGSALVVAFGPKVRAIGVMQARRVAARFFAAIDRTTVEYEVKLQLRRERKHMRKHHSWPTTELDAFDIARMFTAGMLVLALASLPYGYYTILRWTVCSVALYGAFRAFGADQKVWTWIFGVIAILFNPFAPVYLNRATWAVLDLAAGMIIVLSLRGMRSRNVSKISPSL